MTQAPAFIANDPLAQEIHDRLRREHADTPSPDADLLAALIADLAGGDEPIPFGPIAHIAHLYVICRRHMQAEDWHRAYRTIVTLDRIERAFHRDRRARATSRPASSRPASPHIVRPPPPPPRPAEAARPKTRRELHEELQLAKRNIQRARQGKPPLPMPRHAATAPLAPSPAMPPAPPAAPRAVPRPDD